MTKNGEAKGVKTLKLALRKSGTWIEASWSEELKGGAVKPISDIYAIPLRDLKTQSDNVRTALAGIEQYRSTDANLEPLLHKLAQAGEKLYETLLTGDLEHRLSARTAEQFRDWFEKNVIPSPGKWRIQVVHEDYNAPVVPWGLVFTPLTIGKITDLGETWQEYNNFWALSFQLACRGINRDVADGLPDINGDDAVLAMTIKVEDRIVQKYNKDAINRHDYRQQVTSTIKTFEQFPDDRLKHNIFWYVYLNEGESGYYLEDQEIEPSAIQMMVKSRRSSVMIMFLDGNAVIGGERGAKWVQAILHSGHTGIIAAETDIVNPVVNDRGWEFWIYILQVEHKTLLTAITEARQKFWPESLLYGVYCDPVNIEFEPTPHDEVVKAQRFMKFVREEIGQNEEVMDA